ncbi:hypothetical protein DAETH_43530 (plasmid) [Deinococcus aetherius]|uniref:DUF7933 domain-containing protein n=1 Tax=Deinococcus aetherius TaxID=200252 RepID=A0ABM8AKN7_9DEIO|nr:hypothetical protein [Deinococcus aetherius]BDP44384.1 hypothetical protein DAETH_43530 [Deinococcus aetherius]
MKRLFLRLLGLAACVSGGALAASGCTSVYALTSTGINWVDAQSGAVTGTYTTSFTAINGAALNPVTGQLYFIDRSAATTNTLYRYNPQTPTVAPVQIGAVTIPTRNGGTTTSVNVGASFDNSTGTPKLYLLYGNYVLQEVNPSTGATVRTIDLNLANGAQNSTTAISNATTTNGDIVFVGSTLYALLDGETTAAGSGGMFYANFGTVAASGVTALSSSSVVRITSGGTNVARGIYNGISYDPVTARTVLSSGSTGSSGTVLLNTSSGATTVLGSAANLTDMTDCGNTPDPPTIAKSFNSATVLVNQNSRVTLTFGNTNPTPFYMRSAVTDTLPTGVVVASTPNPSTTCTSSTGGAATVTATAGSGSVTLASGTSIPGGGCTLSFDVTANSTGSKVNTIAVGGVVSTAGTNAVVGTATLTVNNAITGTINKRQRNVTQSGTLGTAAVSAKPGETVEYCLTAAHAGTGYADATTATLRDVIPSPLVPLTNSYGTGQDVRITRNAGTSYTYATLASDSDTATYTSSSRVLGINILPFTAGTTVEVCFQAQVP